MLLTGSIVGYIVGTPAVVNGERTEAYIMSTFFIYNDAYSFVFLKIWVLTGRFCWIDCLVMEQIRCETVGKTKMVN